MSLSYTTGNPSNLTAGATASMTDISGPFADIKTFLTDGSGAVGDTMLTSPTNSVWRTVFSHNEAIQNLTTTGSWFTTAGGIIPSGSPGGSAAALWIPSAAADEAVTSKTTKLRTRVSWAANAVTPSVTMTWGIYPVTSVAGTGGQIQLNLGTVVSGSTVAIAVSSAGTGSNTSSGFNLTDLTVGGMYALGVIGSGSQAANSLICSLQQIEMRHT